MSADMMAHRADWAHRQLKGDGPWKAVLLASRKVRGREDGRAFMGLLRAQLVAAGGIGQALPYNPGRRQDTVDTEKRDAARRRQLAAAAARPDLGAMP